MTHATPLSRPSLHAELVACLREMIIDDRFEANTKIPERALCDSFAVSRTPMREALKVLASEGLVILEPNRGAWVANITVEDLEKAFPVLCALETLAGELACLNISDAQLGHIRNRHNAMLQHYHDNNRALYFKANQAIHDLILQAADNSILSHHHRIVAAHIRRARFLANIDVKAFCRKCES